MSSSINSSSNPEKVSATGSHITAVGGSDPSSSSRSDPSTSSQDGRMHAVGAGAIRGPGGSSAFLRRRPSFAADESSVPSRFSGAGGSSSTSDKRVISSAKVLGGATSADSTMSSTSSPYLEDAPEGARYFSDELGRPMRLASFRGPEFPYEVPSRLTKSILAPNSIYPFPSPSPDLALSDISPSPDLSRGEASVEASPLPFSVKYDENSYYNALGDRKRIEDLADDRGMIGPEVAYAYLESMISTPGDFSAHSYLQVNQLLLGMRDVKYRDVEGSSFCIVPKKDTAVMIMNEAGSRVKMSIERLLKIETGMIAINAKPVRSQSGEDLCIYEIKHDTKELPRRLDEYLEEFNQRIADAYASPIEDGQGMHLRAIVSLFMRLEQLRPVGQARRTNLAVLNYLLAKHNFPGVIFKNQYIGEADRISTVDYMSSKHLWNQVIQGMKDWCKVAGRPYPF
ncbi:MAG: hypothetical protein NTX49_05055 [Chlamydiae bacterium]|nr:hypothetical protein [Chlamydiota bacterium]